MGWFKDYVTSLTQEFFPEGNNHWTLLQRADGSLRKIKIGRLALVSTPSGDVVPATTTLDITAIITNDDGSNDAEIIRISGTAQVDTILIPDGVSRWLEFMDSGGVILKGANISVMGGDFKWSAGDRILITGRPLDTAESSNILRASGKAARPSIPAVRTVVTSNITIATDLNAGDTAGGVVLVAGDLVLVTGQTATEQNGIYVAGATPVRASFYDTFEAFIGLFVIVTGTARPTLWFCNAASSGVIDTDSLPFFNITGTIAHQNFDLPFIRFSSSVGALFQNLGTFDTALKMTGFNTVLRVLDLKMNDANHTIELTGANIDLREANVVYNNVTADSPVSTIKPSPTADDNPIYTNIGAAGLIRYILPDSDVDDVVAGRTKRRFRQVDAEIMEVQPSASDELYFIDKDGAPYVATASAAAFSHADLGEWLDCEYVGNRKWIAQTSGRWAV